MEDFARALSAFTDRKSGPVVPATLIQSIEDVATLKTDRPIPVTCVQPDLRVLLGRLKKQTESEEWDAATQTLEAIIEISLPGEVRARYLKVLGSMFLNKLSLAKEAVACWSKALDDSPHEIELFVKLSTTLYQRRDWTELEKQYRKMIERAIKHSGNPKVLSTLWHGLGCLYRDKLDNRAAATFCFERAALK